MMKFLGYRHGMGVELLDLVFSRKLRIKNCFIIAKGSKSKPQKDEGYISPVLEIDADGKTSIEIHDHGVYGSPKTLYYLGVFVPRKRTQTTIIQHYSDLIRSLLSGISEKDKKKILQSIK